MKLILKPKAYGLPKIHKHNTPLRIIILSVNTALYSLASYLQNVISDSLENANSYIANSFDLYNLLLNKRVRETDILVSMDVTSLFTNIPLDLAIESISNRWIFIQKNTKIPMNEFISAIEFVLSSTFFTFNNIIYKQTFGTPMGSPLSPIIADVVMQDLEMHCLNKINCQLIFYFRYVNDILMAASFDKIDQIHNTFNGYHERLKFIIEYEKDRSLGFLDLRLNILNNIIQIDWFHKTTISGRFLSYYSSHPLCHKVGTILSLINRAFLLSHPRFHQKNIEFIIGLLLDNGYNLNLIFEKINDRIKIHIHSNKKHINNSDKNNNNSNDNRNNKKIIVLPYIKEISERAASTVDRSKYITRYRTLNSLELLEFTRTPWN